jgi:prevent-host-death family protein
MEIRTAQELRRRPGEITSQAHFGEPIVITNNGRHRAVMIGTRGVPDACLESFVQSLRRATWLPDDQPSFEEWVKIVSDRRTGNGGAAT